MNLVVDVERATNHDRPNFFFPLKCILINVFYSLNDLKFDSHLPKKVVIICLNDSPSKMIKNDFYFILKALFVLKIFKFLS